MASTKKTTSKSKKASTKANAVKSNKKQTTKQTKKPLKASASKASASKASASKASASKAKITAAKTNKKTIKKIKKTSKAKVEILSYACIKKYYAIHDEKTGEEKIKRMWIVIGKGHKRYRKFNTQAEAISYFRSLKKYAKMKVQSVNSQKFIKTVYTLMEMERKGIKIESIAKKSKTIKSKKPITIDFVETQDYEDEFSQFDQIEESSQEKDFDVDEINKIISENEDQKFIDDPQEEIMQLSLQEKEIVKNEQTILISPVVQEEQKDEDQIELVLEDREKNQPIIEEKVEVVNNLQNDPYALTIEYTMESSFDNNEIETNDLEKMDSKIEENKTDLYSLTRAYEFVTGELDEEEIVDSIIEEENYPSTPTPKLENTLNENKSNEESNKALEVAQLLADNNKNSDEITMTMSTTQLTTVPQDDDEVIGIPSKGKTVLYWSIVILIALILSAATVTAICFAILR